MNVKIKERLWFNGFVGSAAFRMFVLMLLVAAIGNIVQPGVFMTAKNFQSVFKQLAEYGILALAVFICMLSGGIDLSVVYIANFCAIVSGKILIDRIAPDKPGTFWILAVIIMSLLVGAVFGIFNGFLIAKLNVPPMLATLGSGQLFLGISTVITHGKSVTGVPKAYTKAASFRAAGLPVMFMVFLLCALLLGVLVSKTRFGLRVRLIGTSRKTAVFSGINYSRDIVTVYMVSGILASVSGLISLMRASSAKADYGISYVLFSILICVFGGTDPNGGKGSVLAITMATVILQMISTLTNMFSSINSFYRDVAWGGLLLLVMCMNHYFDSRRLEVKK